MSFLWAALPGLLSGAAIGMAYYSSTVVRRRLTLTLRREQALGKLTQHLSRLLSQDQPPAYEEVMRVWEHGVIEVFDELHNQRLWLAKSQRPWRRVPEPGIQWPDFQPAPLLSEEEAP